MSDQTKASIGQFDSLDHWRCPQLGGPVTFGYCRMMNDGLPCRKLADCWQSQIDIELFLKDHYTQEEIQRMLEPSPGRMATVFDVLSKIPKK